MLKAVNKFMFGKQFFEKLNEKFHILNFNDRVVMKLKKVFLKT